VTLAERLRSPDMTERVAGIAALAEQGRADPEELQALADCLGDSRKAVQRPAAEAFAALGARGVPVAAVLDGALASPAGRQRWGAAFALASLGAPPGRTLPVLLETLGADDGDMRWAAAAILVRMEDRHALVQGLGDLLRSGNGAQRKMALYCLRDLDVRSPEVEQAVLWALGDEAWDVRLAAVSTLARLSIDRGAAAERLVVALEGGDVRMRRSAAAALGVLGEASARVRDALGRASASDDLSLRRAAEQALQRLAR